MSSNKENLDILYSDKRLKVKAFLEVAKQKEQETLIKEEHQPKDDNDDEESEDEDEATLWDNHPAEENDSDDELEVVCRPAEIRRSQARNNRSKPYSISNQDYTQSFLSTISHVAAQTRDDETILATMRSLIAPLLQMPNKQQELYRSLCVPETEGDLAGVSLLEFVAILNLPKVTIYLVKMIFKECFTHPADALPYFRKQDGNGNTLIHDIVSVQGTTALTSLRVLLNIRFRNETRFVFDPTAVNFRGQHPLHLTMNKPAFQKEIFDIFNRLNLGILKITDISGNSLLHYAFLNYDSICNGISSVEDKSNHMVAYLQAMFSFEDIKECVSIRNTAGQTPSDLLNTLDNIEVQARQRIQQELSKVSFRRLISEVDQIPVNLPDDALLDPPQLEDLLQDALLNQPQLEAILQENGINLDNGVNQHQQHHQQQQHQVLVPLPQLNNPFPEEDLVHVVIEQQFVMGWACTYVYDPDCNAMFQTPEERDAHMREVHSAFEGSDDFGTISIDQLGLLDENFELPLDEL